MPPSTPLLHPLRTTRAVAGSLARPLARLLGPSRPAFELSSEDREYLRQLAPGITTARPSGTPTATSARLRADEARRAAVRYLDVRREELRGQLLR